MDSSTEQEGCDAIQVGPGAQQWTRTGQVLICLLMAAAVSAVDGQEPLGMRNTHAREQGCNGKLMYM
jgi:hypothetical protein